MALGAKADGLHLVPSAWTPAFITVTPDQLMDPAGDLDAFASAALNAIPAGPLIVRSSAVSETLADRGRFDSQILNTRDAGAVTEALRYLREQGLSAGVSMGAVIQSYRKPSTKGHLSNEYRVSKTRNHWQVEVEYPAYSDYRVNSQRDLLPPGNQALRLPGASLDRALARLGNWAARTFPSRVHMEWVLDAEGLWVVQLDREDDAPDAGVDPTSVLVGKPPIRPMGNPVARHFRWSGCLSTWSQDASPRYRKLRYTPFFRSVTRERYPSLFVLEGRDAITFLKSSSPAQELQETIGDRLVCRTDLNPERSDRFNGFNMPRTDTLTPSQMVEWICRKYNEFTAGEFEPEDFVFIIHAFIPAVSGAWAIADPNQSVVFVDTLWGLPDGLQYLEHDRFEWDVRLNTLVAEHITYKDKFLHENMDGTWTVVPVARPLARRASASRREIGAIATATQELAVKVGEPLQVMWFIGTQAKDDIASSIPWFCHPAKTFNASDSGGFELSAPTSKQVGRPGQKRLPLLEIRSPGDLERIPVAPHRLRLSPDAEYMRDNQFLEKFAELAAAGGHAIEMMGSGLAHAYYIMAKSGAPIIVPSQRGYTRARKLRSFGKLVRDGIPGKITGGGEEVRTVRIRKEDRRALLLSKVIEEVGEVSEATNLDDVRDEIADLFEVVRSLADNEGVSWDDVEKAARQKAERLGSFQNGTVLLNTAASGLSRRSRATDLTLARIVREGSTVVIPHLALIGDSVEVAIGGKDVRVSFSTEGLVLEELGPESDDGQLRLPF